MRLRPLAGLVILAGVLLGTATVASTVDAAGTAVPHSNSVDAKGKPKPVPSPTYTGPVVWTP
jgi:hypothetical protein